jgi:opacity protein-like surface antigen
MKRALLVLVLALASISATAEAQIYFGLNGGYALSTNKLNGVGLGFGGSVGLELTPSISLELSVRNWAVPVTGSNQSLSKGKYSALPIELSGRLRIPLGTSFSLFADVGAGFAFQSFRLDETLAADWESVGFLIEESVDNGLAVHFGLGLELALSPTIALDFGARYHYLRSQGTWTITDIAGGESQTGQIADLDFDAFTFSLGIRISLFGKSSDLR